MAQREIPFLFMRGGTSRGPYLNAADLPSDRDAIAKILLQAVGAGHPLNIDGIGGGNAVTNKVAMLSRSADDAADIDYFFAQVSVLEQLVDFKPTCGNILSGVGPAAIEMGFMPATDPITEVRIKLVNTGALVVARVQTPGGVVRYDGDTEIDGVPGTAARIDLQFMDVVGAATGKLLPTGNLRDQFDNIEVTCMDVAMPTVAARADAFDLSGYESVQELEATSDQDRQPNLEALAAAGNKLVVAVGFAFGDALGPIAEANPDVYFGWIDGYYDGANIITTAFSE